MLDGKWEKPSPQGNILATYYRVQLQNDNCLRALPFPEHLNRISIWVGLDRK